MKISVALICLLRNLMRVDAGALIQPHKLLQAGVLIFAADLALVQRMLEQNGITFVYNEDVEQQPPTSAMALTYCDALPRVYIGIELEEKVNIGLKVAKDKSGTGRKYTHGVNYDPGPLYQPTLTDEEIAIARYVPLKPEQDWTPEQHNQLQAQNKEMEDKFDALHMRVGDDCRRKEALGITALVRAEMVGLSNNGIMIVRHNRMFEHINTTEVGDYLYIQNVFKHLIGRTFIINVDPSNTMKLDSKFSE